VPPRGQETLVNGIPLRGSTTTPMAQSGTFATPFLSNVITTLKYASLSLRVGMEHKETLCWLSGETVIGTYGFLSVSDKKGRQYRACMDTPGVLEGEFCIAPVFKLM
jgi:hypothetical protein